MFKKEILEIGYGYTSDGNIELRIVVEGKKVTEKIVKLVGLNKQLEVIIDTIKKKRSSLANNYYQELLEQLRDVIGTSHDELHAEMIRQYGPIRTHKGGGKIIVAAIKEVDGKEISKYTRRVGSCELNGKEGNYWAILKGSSEMDSKEFSLLLDGLISECKNQDPPIETMTPAELERLKGYVK